MNAPSHLARWNQLGVILASRWFGIFVATTALLDAMIEAIEAREAAMPGAPLTATRVLRKARYGGVQVFAGVPDLAILLATLGLDLSDPGIREQILELNRRGEITLVGIEDAIMHLAREGLSHEGQPPELIDGSALVDRGKTYHAVLV